MASMTIGDEGKEEDAEFVGTHDTTSSFVPPSGRKADEYGAPALGTEDFLLKIVKTNLDEYKKKIDGMAQEVSNLQERQEKLQEDLKDKMERQEVEFDKLLTQKTQDSKEKVIEILGIFVALFTFVSVDIQFFRAEEITFLSLVGFTLITLGGLAFFILFLHISLRIGSDWKSYPRALFLNPVFLVLTLLLGFGIGFVSYDGFHKVLRKDFFLETQRETKATLSLFEKEIATSTRSISSMHECSKTFNSYWEFKTCLNK